MEFSIIDCEQKSDEWFSARCGVITGTMAKDVLSKKSDGIGRWKSLNKLFHEQRSGKPIKNDFDGNKYTKKGTENEPFTRMFCESRLGKSIRETGFIKHNKLPIGCSLDGDIDNFRTVVELKSVEAHVITEWIIAGKIPSEHMPQVRHNTFTVRADKAIFYAKSEDAAPGWDEFIVEIDAGDLMLDAYEKAVYGFLYELKQLEEKLLPLKLEQAA